MSKFTEAASIGFDEAIDVLTGEDTFAEAMEDVKERLQDDNDKSKK